MRRRLNGTGDADEDGEDAAGATPAAADAEGKASSYQSEARRGRVGRQTCQSPVLTTRTRPGRPFGSTPATRVTRRPAEDIVVTSTTSRDPVLRGEWLRPGDAFVGMTGFGASGPADALYRHFGITVPAIVAEAQRVHRQLARAATPSTSATH